MSNCLPGFHTAQQTRDLDAGPLGGFSRVAARESGSSDKQESRGSLSAEGVQLRWCSAVVSLG